MSDITFEQTDRPDRADADAVDAGLHRSNRAAADYSTLRELACFARLPSGALAGGAMARTWGRCCELQQLWVDESYRRQGIGSRLIDMVEREARARGCTLIYLETCSFQAPALYRSLGYSVACEFSGFPHGGAKYVMHKSLVGAESVS